MEIFKLFGSIFVNTDEADKSMKKTEKGADSIATKLGNGIKTAAKWGAGIVAAATAGAAALYGVATRAAEAMDAIDKGSAKIGISKQAYQEWNYVLGQNGMSIDKLETGMKTLVSQMDSAAGGTESACENFEKLGLSIYDSNEKLKDQETMLNETMIALANMENGTEKARLATELFGRAGVEMMPMLNGGAEGIAELTNRAHDLGLIMSDDAVTAGVVLGDTIDDVKQSFSAIVNTIGVQVMPIIQSLLDWILENMPTIQAVVGTVFNVIETVVNAVMGAVGNAKDSFAQYMPEIMSFFQEAVAGMKDTWENHLKPMFEAIGVFLNDYIKPAFEYVWQNFVVPLIENVFSYIGELWTGTLKPVFDAICDFITGVFTGDWQLMKESIENIMQALFNGITTRTNAIKNTMSSIWNNIKSDVVNIWNSMKAAIELGITMAKNKIFSVFDNIKNGIKTKIEAARDVVKNAIDRIKGFFNFEWSLPHLKMPHPTIRGSFSLNPPSVPSFGIEWYAKAMNDPIIMNSPTAFGINSLGQIMAGGERGSEVVSGTETLMRMIAEAVASQNKDVAASVNNGFAKLLSLLMQYFPQFANMQVVVDNGALIGELVPGIDEALGLLAKMYERGI